MAEAVVLCTQDYSGLGLALLMQQQGSTVVCGYQHSEEDQDEEDLDALEKIGTGLLPKMPLEDAIRRYAGNDTLWFFDDNSLASTADKLNRRGESVIGSSALSQKMEKDRDYAASIAERVGLEAPQTERFTDYAAALKFLRSHADRAYAFKPFGGDPSQTHVPLSADPAIANEELQAYLETLEADHPKFILQEIVHGIEVAFDLWLRHGEPIAAFCDLEAKRRLNGDLGELIGCGGGYTLLVPLTCRGIRETVGKYLVWKDLHDYTGSVDANVIFVDGKPLFLENSMRVAYLSYPAIFHCLTQRPMEEIVRDWIAGTGDLTVSFRKGFAGALALTADNPRTGSPVIVPPKVADAVDLSRVYRTNGHLALVQGWPEIMATVALGSTIENAAQQCIKAAEAVSFPGRGYRTDLGSAELPTLPLARYRALAAMGMFAE